MSKKMTMCFVELEDIKVGKRLRPLDENAVEAMMDSLKTMGQINPIILDDKYFLVTGWHRLEAARRLGWKDIFTRTSEESELGNQMIEVDENLIRKELTSLERSIHIGRRKSFYEKLHPASKQYSKEKMSAVRHAEIIAARQNVDEIPYYAVQNEDGTWRERTNEEYVEYYKTFPRYNDRYDLEELYDPRLDYDNSFCVPAIFDILERNRWQSWNDGDPVTQTFGHPRTDKRPEIILPESTVMKSFTKDTAEKMGVSERTIRQEVAIAKNLSQEIVDLLTGTALADRKADLIMLSQQEPDVQEEIVQMFLSGEITKISEYFDSDKGSVRNRKKKDNPYELPAEPKMKAKPKFDDEDDEKPVHDFDTVNLKEDIVALLKTYSTSKSRVCQDAIKKINMYLLTVPTIKY